MSRYKLVRDLIPKIIKSRGEKAETLTLGEELIPKELKRKLIEEAEEVFVANKKELAEELADVIEVAFSLAKKSGISRKTIEKVRVKKRRERGGFEKGTLLKC